MSETVELRVLLMIRELYNGDVVVYPAGAPERVAHGRDENDVTENRRRMSFTRPAANSLGCRTVMAWVLLASMSSCGVTAGPRPASPVTTAAVCVESPRCPCVEDGGSEHAAVRRTWGCEDPVAALARLRVALQQSPQEVRLGALAVAIAIDSGESVEPMLDALGPESAAGRVGLALSALHAFHLAPSAKTRGQLDQRLRESLAVAAEDPHALAAAVSAKLVDATGSTGPNEIERALVLCAEHDPEREPVLATSCARVHYAAGQASRAQALLARATELDGDHAPAWLVWGQAELAAGDLGDARARLGAVLRSPSRALRYQAHLGLGVAAKRSRDLEEARHQWGEALALCDGPVPPELAYDLGILLAEDPDADQVALSIPLLQAFLASPEADDDPVRTHRVRQALDRAKRAMPSTPVTR